MWVSPVCQAAPLHCHQAFVVVGLPGWFLVCPPYISDHLLSKATSVCLQSSLCHSLPPSLFFISLSYFRFSETGCDYFRLPSASVQHYFQLYCILHQSLPLAQAVVEGTGSLRPAPVDVGAGRGLPKLAQSLTSVKVVWSRQMSTVAAQHPRWPLLHLSSFPSLSCSELPVGGISP